MQKADKSVELFTEVLKTCNAIGYKKTLEATITARQNTQTQNEIQAKKDYNKQIIINEVCNVFNITEAELNRKHGKGGLRMDALMICCAYFRQHQKFDLKDISVLFETKPHISRVSRYCSFIFSLSDKNKPDKVLMDKYAKLQQNLENKILA